MPNSAWMGDNFEAIKDHTVSDFLLLGSHDSGAYKVDFTKPLDDSCKTKAINFFGRLPIIGRIIQEWTITQHKDIKQQLIDGVRALDLRVSYNINDTRFYVSHTFVCEEFEFALKQISSFLAEHSREILIIKLQADTANAEYIQGHETELFGLLQQQLGDLLCTPRSGLNDLNLTLSTMVSNNQRIICFSNINIPEVSPEARNIWDWELTKNNWLEKTNVSDWCHELESRRPAILNLSERTCNSLDMTLTPDTCYIFKNFWFQLPLIHWLAKKCCGTPLERMAKEMEPVIEATLKDKPLIEKLTIVNSDFPSEKTIHNVIKICLERKSSLKPPILPQFVTTTLHTSNASNSAVQEEQSCGFYGYQVSTLRPRY